MTDRQLSRYALCWGGQAGDGLQSAGTILAKFLNSVGYYVHGVPGTQSTIRGGHIWEQIEFSTDKIYCHDRQLNMLVAFSDQTLTVHLRDLIPGGILIFNSDKVSIGLFQTDLQKKNISIIDVPLIALAKEADPKTQVLVNTVAIGIILAILGLSPEKMYLTLEKQFSEKAKVVEINKK